VKVRGGDAACQSQQPAALAPLQPNTSSMTSLYISVLSTKIRKKVAHGIRFK